jgi:DNA-binding transcriptional ArsR family regulator
MTTQKYTELISLESMAEAANCLKTLAHPCRLRMIEMLLDGECSVGELAKACEIPSHMASEHLGTMRDRGFLNAERRGRSVFYSVAEEGLASILDCVRKRFGSTGG